MTREHVVLTAAVNAGILAVLLTPAPAQAYPTTASWYGPGLYGNPLGCGGTFGPGTPGIAHKTLACGTRVTITYRGRRALVRVVDRGPFIPGREVDLTNATRLAVGFPNGGDTVDLRVGWPRARYRSRVQSRPVALGLGQTTEAPR